MDFSLKINQKIDEIEFKIENNETKSNGATLNTNSINVKIKLNDLQNKTIQNSSSL